MDQSDHPFKTKVLIPLVAQIIGYRPLPAESFFGTCPQLKRTTSPKVMSLPWHNPHPVSCMMWGDKSLLLASAGDISEGPPLQVQSVYLPLFPRLASSSPLTQGVSLQRTPHTEATHKSSMSASRKPVTIT